MKIERNYNSVDFAKMVFAIFVVAIHTNLASNLPEPFDWYLMQIVFRLAVPFFITVSAFMLGLGIRNKGVAASLKKYRKKLLPVYIFWGGIGTALHFAKLLISNHNIGDSLIRTIQTIIFYPSGSMWFLYALLIGSFILEIAVKYFKSGVAWIVAIALYVIALLGNSYYFVSSEIGFQGIMDRYLDLCISPRNGLFLFLFIWVGYSMADEKVIEYAQNKRLCILGLCISMLILIFESWFTYGKQGADDSSLYLSTPFAVAMIMMVLIGNEMTKHMNYREMRRYSSDVYYTHPFFNTVINYMLPGMTAIRFVIVLALSTTTYFIFRRSENRFIRMIL